MAQLVEYDLAKVGVAGSNPVCRSEKANDFHLLFSLYKNVSMVRGAESHV